MVAVDENIVPEQKTRNDERGDDQHGNGGRVRGSQSAHRVDRG
jgi:hypothetical protein